MTNPTAKSNPCPYRSLPRTAYWRHSVAAPAQGDVDPLLEARFAIGANTKVATAGSCFAQHVARYLQKYGDNYFIVEKGHPKLSEKIRSAYNFGVFSARYGNIYTTRQMVQLFDRAHGILTPQEEPWSECDDFIDPFRPAIQPHGFASIIELERDRVQHLAAVKRMFAEMDVFVFTLGLTEGWITRSDGVALPVCPGCGAGGSYDSDKYSFVNETVSDVTRNLHGLLERIRSVNPAAKVLFTVSPVPLVATNSGQHVLTATTYSKSVLRAAVGEIYTAYDYVDYFPSYEIITGSYSRGAYFEEDLRSVHEEGVHHVMKLIFKHYLGKELPPLDAPTAKGGQRVEAVPAAPKVHSSAMVAKLVCEEDLLEI